MTVPITTTQPLTNTKVSVAGFGSLVATDLAAIGTALNSAWTDISSTFFISTDGSAVTKGASTVIARYKQIGKMVDFGFKITIGSGFAAGSGNYLFALPVTPHATGVSQICGSCWINDSGTALRVGSAVSSSATTIGLTIYNITGGSLGAAGPGTAWAANDQIIAQVRYEAA